MALKYVAPFETVLQGDDGEKYTLLWGDQCRTLGPMNGPRTRVRARARTGTVPSEALGDQRLLEIYIIDVGQGDGILVRTPDDAWHMIDGGTFNRKQDLKKGAPNFVRWKFREDLREDTVRLRNMVLTHPDTDHFGGLVDILSGKFGRDQDDTKIEVENFFHNGLGKFPQKSVPKPVEGTVDEFPRGDRGIPRKGKFRTDLLDRKTSFKNPPTPFGAEFAELAKLVAKVPKNVHRVDSSWQFLHGYGEGENEVVMRVLGPVLERFGNQQGLRVLGSQGETVNGHSVVLRLDYGRARILLTGDLNDPSQKLLLSYEPEESFAVDVAKACHHGSEDVALAFVKAMRARSTVISSGDNEGFAHPRPVLMGASGRYGREGVDATKTREEVMPPLVYSTELARSVKLSQAREVRVPGESAEQPRAVQPADTEVLAREEKAEFKRLDRTPLSTDLIYGLVNVRTDGKNILCATLEEQGTDFDVKVFCADKSPSGGS
ncbi:MAG: hypothetical protein M3340_14015 [Actinomycetota bacterium]|nr:hypothetical protein [Actinomycetota bacterium]